MTSAEGKPEDVRTLIVHLVWDGMAPQVLGPAVVLPTSPVIQAIHSLMVPGSKGLVEWPHPHSQRDQEGKVEASLYDWFQPDGMMPTLKVISDLILDTADLLPSHVPRGLFLVMQVQAEEGGQDRRRGEAVSVLPTTHFGVTSGETETWPTRRVPGLT
ncbi:hypothetical protein PG984_006526 [Apiospora sp. TS-2023a]